MSSVLAARARRTGFDVAVGTAPAAVVGYAIASRPALTLPLMAAAAAVWVLCSPSVAAIALGASLPALQDVTRGHLGVHIAASDLLLTLLGIQLIGDAAITHGFPALRALRPVRAAVMQYAVAIVLLLAIHPAFGTMLKSGQRLELLVLPLLVGAVFGLRNQYLLALRAYVLASTVLAALWPLNLPGLKGELQKNPTGQLLANAILVLLAVPALRRFLPCLPVLAVGLLLTGSRGAILALLLGVAVIVVLRGGRDPRFIAVRLVPLAITAIIAFQWLPTGVRSHVTQLSATSNSGSAGYSIYVRDQYQRDAQRLISEHPWTGVGVGNYLSADVRGNARSLDPHNVILLQAAEGGYVFAASFVLLILGSLLAAWRVRGLGIAVAAIAVQIATVAHGMVDVYWVRGTPVLGWLLIGMVCGVTWRNQRAHV